MTALSTQFQQNYAQHPSFQFPQPTLDLNESSLSAFNDSYRLLDAYGGMLDRGEFDTTLKKCVDSLHTLFHEFSVQANDGHEAAFLEELRLEIRRLLIEECGYFRRRARAKPIVFRNAATAGNLLSLANMRFYFGGFSPSVVDRILDIGRGDLAMFRESAARGHVRRDDLSLAVGPKILDIMGILNHEYRDLGVLDSLRAYTGRGLSVTGVALELSVPQATWWANSLTGISRAPQTLYAHFDEAVGNPKSIVYLSEVNRENGPTSCYAGVYEDLSLNPLQSLLGRVVVNVGNNKGSPLSSYYAKQYHQSMTSEPFRRHFMRLPQPIRFNSHFGWDVLPGSEFEESLVSRERYMLGMPGTFLVFDGGRLLHRGGMLKSGERVVLQVIFGQTNRMRSLVRRVKRFIP